MTRLRKRQYAGHKRVPFTPAAASYCSSEIHFYYQISLPNIGTIYDAFSPPTKICGSRIQRVPFCAPKSFKRASLTVEAALTLPLFFLCILSMISIMNVYGESLDRSAALRDTAMAAATLSSSGKDEVFIDLNVPHRFTPFFLPKGTAAVYIPCRAYVRTWNGRDEASLAEGQADTTEYVYVTENRSVYHTSADCTHIDLSIHAEAAAFLPYIKNDYGESYSPCEKCAADGSAGSVVYITPCGCKYHCSAECSGLTRTIELVSADETGGLHECSRCAASHH